MTGTEKQIQWAEDRSLERYGEDGWMFTARDINGIEREYRTNGNGEGLWVRKLNGHDWQQISGTCQFSMIGDEEQARRKVSEFERANAD